MANDCLQTKLKASVQNEGLPKLGELILEMINEPGGNALRSGVISVISGSITTKARIVNVDTSVVFSNQNAREFIINNGATDANRALGTSKDTLIGFYPGNNININLISEHVKELNSTFVYFQGTSILFQTTADYVALTPCFTLDKVKNVFDAPNLISLNFGNVWAYGGTIEELCIACSVAKGGNVPYFAIHTSANSVAFTFNGSMAEANYAFKVVDSVIKVYDTVEHIDNDTYLKATYQNGTWAYV